MTSPHRYLSQTQLLQRDELAGIFNIEKLHELDTHRYISITHQVYDGVEASLHRFVLLSPHSHLHLS